MKTLLSILMLLLLQKECTTQVYNYQLMNYKDAETNPAALASADYRESVALTQQGRLPGSGRFSYQSASLKYYSPTYYSGIAAGYTNTQINKNDYCRTLSIGGAYSVMLLDKMVTQIGVSYKWNWINPINAQYKEYSISELPETNANKRNLQTINTSVQLNSRRSKDAYLSLAVLNIPTNSSSSAARTAAPLYYVVNVGDPLRLLFPRSTHSCLTTVIKKDAVSTQFSQSISVSQVMAISRRFFLVFALNAGYYNYDSQYFLFRPQISFCRGGTRSHLRYYSERIRNRVDFLYTFNTPQKAPGNQIQPSLQLKYTHHFKF